MATPSINSQAMPTSLIRAKGYTFHPQPVAATRGDGLPIRAGMQQIVWVFDHMTPTEWDWWATTLLSGARQATISAAELWDDDMAEQTFTAGILHKPVAEKYRGGLYWNVTVTITNLLPIV